MPRRCARPDQSAFNKVALNSAFCELSRTPHPGQPLRPSRPLPRRANLFRAYGAASDTNEVTFPRVLFIEVCVQS